MMNLRRDSTKKKLFQAIWGIAGAGKICADFVVAIKTLDPCSHVVAAVGSRSHERAREFAERFSIDDYYEGYLALAYHDDVNVVYIGVVNSEHYKLAKMMLDQGKNVVVEKPMCMSAAETKDLIRIARENMCFLMEAVWSRMFPAYQEIERQLGLETCGTIFQVHASLGFTIHEIDRIWTRKLGGGSIMDLGVYVLQFAQLIFHGLKPLEIIATGDLNEDGVDENAVVIMKYPGGRFAVLTTHTRIAMGNSAEIFGTRSYIRVPDFWCPISVEGPEVGRKRFSLPDTNSPTHFYNSTGLSYEAEEVRRCLSAGELESPLMTLDQSYEIALWRDQILEQLGVRFD